MRADRARPCIPVPNPYVTPYSRTPQWYFPVQVRGNADFQPPGCGNPPRRHGTLVSSTASLQPARVRDYIRYLKTFPRIRLAIFGTTRNPVAEEKIYVVQTNQKSSNAVSSWRPILAIWSLTRPADLAQRHTSPSSGGGAGSPRHEPSRPRARAHSAYGRPVSLLCARRLPEGIEKEAEAHGVPPRTGAKTTGDIRKGFVYKRVPHITLKSIANNEEIDAIYSQLPEAARRFGRT